MTFGEVVALYPTDLQIPAGKTTVLIGPSGCGKSTILRLIIGLLQPTNGHVHVAGGGDNLVALRRQMGYVIQDGGLFPHLNARENVLLMPRQLKQDEAAMNRRLTELCNLTHFSMEALERYPVELSGGQRQRVSLMRALALDPDILLLDEPLGALDPMVRASLQRELKEIFANLGKTVVMVTHDMAEAAFLADMIVLLRAGEVVQSGSLDELRDQPAEPYVNEFIDAQRSLVQL